MPKKIPRPKDKYKHSLISRLECACDLRGIDIQHQRVIARKSQTTYDDRRKDPGKFTLDELLRFATHLKVPVWDLLNPNVNINLEVKQ